MDFHRSWAYRTFFPSRKEYSILKGADRPEDETDSVIIVKKELRYSP
jgi:hypothetical protein